MKKILLCGANGFIGKNLLKRFSNNKQYEIRATYFNSTPDVNYTENVEWIKTDLRNPQDVERAVHGVDIILQYAATSTGAKDIVSKPYIHVTDNAVMNSLILREAFEQNVDHFIMPSCTIMYKPSSTPLLESDFDESDEIYPVYYGAGNTKVYLEKMCKFYSDFGRTKHTVLRQSNIYGPHDKFDLDKSHVFGATVTKVMTNSNDVVVWGSGEEERDFLFVDDLIDLVEASIDTQEEMYELVNASFGKAISIDSLVKEVVKVSQRDLKISYDKSKPTIKTKIAIDNKLAKEKFGWTPNVRLASGIKKTIDWYRQNETVRLTETQIEHYREKGYVVVPNVISSSDREIFKKFMRRHVNEDFASLMNPYRAKTLEDLDERVGDEKAKECAETARMAKNVMSNPNVVEIMSQLQNTRNFVGISSQYIFKEPNTKYANQAWNPHQDNYWPSNKSGAYFTFNWYLDKTDVENGCVYVYEGSHKAGLLPAEYVMSFREEAAEDGITRPGPRCEVPEEYKNNKKDIILDENCFVFFDGNLIHGTYNNITKNRPRPWYSCCYILENEDYVVGEFSKRIETDLFGAYK